MQLARTHEYSGLAFNNCGCVGKGGWPGSSSVVQALMLGLERNLNMQVPWSMVPCVVHHYQSSICFNLDGYGECESCFCWEWLASFILSYSWTWKYITHADCTLHTCLKHCSQQGSILLPWIVASLIHPHNVTQWMLSLLLAMQTVSLYTVIAHLMVDTLFYTN